MLKLKFCIFLYAIVAINVTLAQLSMYGQYGGMYFGDQNEGLDDNFEINLKLINHYSGPFYNSSKEQCWNKCLKEHECAAISFCKDCNDACFMYKSDKNGITRNDKYVSKAKKGENLKSKPMVTLHYNTKLTNLYKGPFFNIITGDQCWEKCLNERECVAISFCEYCKGECSLFKKGDFTARQNSDYITIAYETEKLINEYPGKTLWNEPLKGPFHISTKDQCWKLCLRVNQCTGISFCSSCNNECYLYDDKVYGLVSNANSTTMIFERKSYAELASVRPGEIILDRYESSYWFSSVNICWSNCLNNRDCVAISFVKKWPKVNCFLFKNIPSALTFRFSKSISIAKKDSFFNLIVNINNSHYAFDTINGVKKPRLMPITKRPFSIKSPSNNSFVKPSDQPYPATKLVNHYKGPFNMHSQNDCWEMCSNESECVAISFCYSCNRACFLYTSGNYGVARDEFYTTLSLDTERDNFRKTITIEHGRQLTNHYKQLHSKKDYQCWSECMKESQCVAITFCEECDRACYLFKRGQFGVIKDRRYKSIAYHTEDLNPIKIGKVYNDLMLLVTISVSNHSDKEQCWTECLRTTNCSAISFCPSTKCNSTCFLYDSVECGVISSSKFVSIAVETEKLEDQRLAIVYHKKRMSQSSHFFLEVFSINNEQECWQKCLEHTIYGCAVVSFSPNPEGNECLLFRSGDNYVQR